MLKKKRSDASALSDLIQQESGYLGARPSPGLSQDEHDRGNIPGIMVEEAVEPDENTSLLPRARLSYSGSYGSDSVYKDTSYVERQWVPVKGRLQSIRQRFFNALKKTSHPKEWDIRHAANAAVGALAAVFLGLLLNLLDALSYGMILFPLGDPIFENTGPDGISIFYVSCIVSQLVYSLGGTRFKGGVGSEMIEVVPFFHKMAYMILGHIGSEKPDAVLTTTIVSYALSSIITGVIFLALGALRLGDFVSFFPRSILLGCIGGVGVFLFLTGLEVSAGLDSNLEWDFDVLQRLFVPTTLMLWAIPLGLAILLILIRRRFPHPVVMPLYFICVVATFYVVTKGIRHDSMADLQKNGWVFQAPQAGVPFYNFYKFYNFKLVDWEAIGKTIPTMFALSFFGIIHVPINVPALGMAVQEDDVNINRELLGHGLSNTLSGLVGSIQNYLVFANSRLFIENGGNSRWAGILLALGTTGIWIAGPAMIGYIPIMVVGTLIFLLGIEMCEEALWDTVGKLHKKEYLMIVAIALVMGFYDFVAGIVLGIILACLIFVIQTANVSAIRGIYSGKVAESTVRRHPVQRRFLRKVGTQVKVIKLAGYLFFGTIVNVEKQIREIIDEEAFRRQPIRYLILDFTHVNGMDFSAAEAFLRMNRILRGKAVEMVISGASLSSDTGRSMIMVGLLEEGNEHLPAPRTFEDLNQALEACENELLLAFMQKSEQLTKRKPSFSTSGAGMTIPRIATGLDSSSNTIGIPAIDPTFSSPRANLIHQAAASTLQDHYNIDGRHASLSNPITDASKYTRYAQPLPLLLQAFKDLTTKSLDFWHQATPYFTRREYTAGTVLYSRGDEPDGFYILEEGILRAEYELEQGRYYESIVAGTTCGELPFFSDSARTGTVTVEKDVVAWLLSKERWRALEQEKPELARELLVIGLKLTRERMESITS